MPLRARLSLHVAAAMLALLAGRAAAQDAALVLPPRAHADIAYVELFGPGGLYSLNYERRLDPATLVRAGVTRWTMTPLLDNVRHEVTAVIGGATHLVAVDGIPGLGGGPGRYVELGGTLVAGTFAHWRADVEERSGGFVSIVPVAGLRRDPPAGGFLYRLSFTPLLPLLGAVGTNRDMNATMYAGASAGWVF